MGKKRVAKKAGGELDVGLKERALAKVLKKKLLSGVLYVQSTYNNTFLTLTDEKGNTIMWTSSGAIGFKGTKKGTPYASSKAAELIAEKAKSAGIKKMDVVIRGIGAGRESAIRTIAAKGIEITSIRDATPAPHNGPKPPKPRRV